MTTNPEMTKSEPAMTLRAKIQKLLPSFSARPKAKKRVLMIEDETDIADITCIFLKCSGYESYRAGNTVEAEEAIGRMAPDAVILDINLPGENGLDFLARFKESFPAVPVIIYTSEGYDEQRMKTALAHGASGFLSKLMDLETILVTLRNVMAPRSLQPVA